MIVLFIAAKLAAKALVLYELFYGSAVAQFSTTCTSAYAAGNFPA